MLAQDTRNASANADLLSFRIMSAGNLRQRPTARGVALTVSDPVCSRTSELVRKPLSRSSRRSESKLPKISPTKPPAKASTFVFDEVNAAEGLAREATVELGVMKAGFAAVSPILFSKLSSNDLIES